MSQRYPPPPRSNSLSQISEKLHVQNIWFNSKEVHLDGYTFTNCRFDNCKIYVNSHNFVIDRCIIDSDSTVIIGGDIIKVIQLFNFRIEPTFVHYPEFAPTRNDDGTISITG